jgi:hypothetical protein
MLHSLLSILDSVNVPSRDDGTRFLVDDRIRGIRSQLIESRYVELKGQGLSYVYAREDFDVNRGYVLISCHADSVYRIYFHWKFSPDELIGTFDNAICIAILIHLMKTEQLPANVVVAFTGDEEDEARGADETMDDLTDDLFPDTNPEMVIVLDVTSEGYRTHSYTAENLFAGVDVPNVELQFDDIHEFIGYVQRIFGQETLIIPEADPDESWEYDEWNVNCLALCLPTGPPPENAAMLTGAWMHNDRGILVSTESIPAYARALCTLCSKLMNDIDG